MLGTGEQRYQSQSTDAEMAYEAKSMGNSQSIEYGTNGSVGGVSIIMGMIVGTITTAVQKL